MLFIKIIAIGVASLFLTGLVRRYALVKNMIDIPNHRSAHAIPVPRGGGVAFVISFLFFILLNLIFNLISVHFCLALLGSGFIVAAVGFLDDQYHLPYYWRLLGHFIACIFALIAAGGVPPLVILGYTIQSGFIPDVIMVVFLVWLLNLYNFMDGIDGLAALEAITVSILAFILCSIHGLLDWMESSFALVAVLGGFLWWNFPPARIFMGDVGSGFLGLILGIFALFQAKIQPELFWGWMILLGVFIVDSTMTLIVRATRKEKLSEAHRTHAYQQLLNYGWSHLKINIYVFLINVFWLFPMALLVQLKLIDGFLGLLIVYTPLSYLAYHLGCGIKIHAVK